MLSIVLYPKDEEIWVAQILGLEKAQRQGHMLSSFQSSILYLNFLTHKNAIYQCHVLEGRSYTTGANAERTQKPYYPSVYSII